MADTCFRHPRLAALYDPLDPDPPDLVPYLRMAEEFGAQEITGPGQWRATLRAARTA